MISLGDSDPKLETSRVDHPHLEILTQKETMLQMAEGTLTPTVAFYRGQMPVRGDVELGKRSLTHLGSPDGEICNLHVNSSDRNSHLAGAPGQTMEERSMANITGTVTQVFNSNSTGCSVVHDPVADMDEVLIFWPGPSGAPNNLRLFYNDMLCAALSSGKTVTVMTTTPTSATVYSVQINA